MINKSRRLSKALLKESWKRLPFIMLVLAVLILGQGVKSYFKIRDNSNSTNQLIHQVAELSKQNQELLQQIKDSQAQNIKLSEEGKAYTKCIGLAFLEYINTHNPVVLQDNDLNACVLIQVAMATSSSAQPVPNPPNSKLQDQNTTQKISSQQNSSPGVAESMKNTTKGILNALTNRLRRMGL